jgi:putative transposase
MAARAHYTTKFELGECYHVYNASVAKEPIFEKDYYCRLFLRLLKEELLPWIDLYAWCLMKNHFHLLFKVAPQDDRFVEESLPKTDWNAIVSHGLGVACQAFAIHYNRAHRRQGTLLQNPFKRVHIDSDDYFTQAVYYIHNNPNHHHLMPNFEDYRWSSYQSHLSAAPTNIDRETVLNWFGGRDLFIEYHAKRPRLSDSKFWIE